jgi:opacity protein-like surface antigen
MKLKSVLMSLLLGGFPLFAVAQPVTVAQPQVDPSISASWYVGLDFGRAYSPHSDIMTVDNGSGAPPPYNLDQYSTKDQKQPLFGFQAGRRWARNQFWFPAAALGLRYQHFSEREIEGSVTQYSTPIYTNYAYTWSSRSNVLSVNGKLNVFQLKRLLPYISGGIGGAHNRTGAYKESAYANITPRLSPDYTSNNQTNFYYDAGVGLDVLVTTQLIVSLGYNYHSLGEITSGSGHHGWEGTRLGLDGFDTHTALLSLTYLI